MLNQIGPIGVFIRLRSAASRRKTLANLEIIVLTCSRFLSSAGDGNIAHKEQAVLLKKETLSRIGQLTEAGFNIGVFLFIEAYNNDVLTTILVNTLAGIPDHSTACPYLQGGIHMSNIAIETAMDLHCFSDDDNLYTVTESACAFRLPNPPMGDIPTGFPIKKFRTALAMVNTGTAGKDDITPCPQQPSRG